MDILETAREDLVAIRDNLADALRRLKAHITHGNEVLRALTLKEIETHIGSLGDIVAPVPAEETAMPPAAATVEAPAEAIGVASEPPAPLVPAPTDAESTA